MHPRAEDQARLSCKCAGLPPVSNRDLLDIFTYVPILYLEQHKLKSTIFFYIVCNGTIKKTTQAFRGNSAQL